MVTFNKKFLFILAFVTGWCSVSPVVHAENQLDNSLKVSVSKKSVSFSIFDQDIEADLSTLGLSWNYSFKQGFFGINLSQTLQDDTVAVESQGFGTLSREDYNLVLGYNLLPWLSVFGGYIYGETAAQVRDFEVTPAFISSIYIRHQGPYLGLGLNYRLKQGSLGVNVAYANMDGSFTSRALQNTSSNISATTTGSTTGFSYSLFWVGEMTESMTYNIGFKVNRYNFEDEDLDHVKDSSTKENFSIVSFGVSKYY